MSDMHNNPEPLSNEQIDKIFGMSLPDFTGEEPDHPAQGGEDEMIDCCLYHFVKWLKDAVEEGRLQGISAVEKERATKHLQQVAQQVYQSQDEEEETNPLIESLKQLAPNLANLLDQANNAVLMEGVTESVTFQAVPDGIRLLAGGKTMKIPARDAVVMAATIGGWIFDNENMREMFTRYLKSARDGLREVRKDSDNND